jgi:hypothetical protein
MSETEGRDVVPEGAEEEVDGSAEGGPRGVGGSLLHRIRNRDTNTELTPAERKRRLAYAGGGAVVTALVAVLGFRWLRRRG